MRAHFFHLLGFFSHPGNIKPSCLQNRGSSGAIGVAAENGAHRYLSIQRPNLPQWVLMIHLLMLNCPHPHRPPMCSSSSTALHQDLLQTTSTIHGLRHCIAFFLHLRGLQVPSVRRGDMMRSMQGTLRSHGAKGAIQMQNIIIFLGLKQRPEKG